MINISNLNQVFSVDVAQSAASEADIGTLLSFSTIDVPQEYIQIVRQATDIEILVNNRCYIRIWSPLGCVEMNEAYSINRRIPNSLAIGDDEGDRAILYANGKMGFGLYLVEFGNLDLNDAIYISPSLTKLLIDGEGSSIF